MTVTARDVSQWNPITDYNAVSRNTDILIARTSQNTFEDPTFRSKYAGARSVPMRLGLYHFLQPNGDPYEQFNFLIQIYRSLGRKIRAFFLDCEAIDYWTRDVPSLHVQIYPISKEHYTWMIMTFLEQYEKETGFIPGIYTAQSMWNTYVYRSGETFTYNGNTYTAPDWSRYPLWIASYRFDAPAMPADWDTWIFWQQTATELPGATGVVDFNIFNGDHAQFVAWMDGDETLLIDSGPNLRELSLCWPCDPTFQIGQRFGQNPQDYYPYPGHDGIDFLVPSGCNIYSMANGIVEEVDDTSGGALGIHISIKHQIGSLSVRTIYAHLQKTLVSVGEAVSAGTKIAISDNTGRSTGPHLHVTVQVDGYQTPGYPAGTLDFQPYLKQEVPVPTTPTNPPSIPTFTKFKVNCYGLRVRLSHGLSGTVIAAVNTGTTFEITGKTVSKDGYTWVEAKVYLAKEGNGVVFGALS